MRPVLAAMALLVAFAATAWADGVVIPSRAVVGPVRTPDQRALLTFDGTTETLVVETTLQGDGREFAWIVPLPAVPKVEASTTGLFPTLEVMTSPRVEDDPYVEWALPISVAVGLLGAFVAWRVIRASRVASAVAATWIGGVAGFVALAVLSVQLLVSSKSAGSPDSPHELSRERVGAFDVATIDPGDGSGLRRWLDEHGFVAPPAVDAVAADYARRGWVFVAAKLTTEAASAEVRRVHPLAFTFPATQAVYPMRLTLAANPECSLELFVLGAGTADAPGLTVEHSGPGPSRGYDRQGVHREIARRGGGATTLTKLAGTLREGAAADDVALRFDEPREIERVLATERVAVSVAAEPACWAGVAVGLLVSIAAGLWRRDRPLRAMRRRLLAFSAGPVAAALVFPIALARIPVVPDGARRVYEYDVSDLGTKARAAAKDTAFTDVESARRWTADFVARLPVTSPGDPRPREEDSPGNYTIRETDGRLEIVTYDGSGRETATDLRAGR